MFAHNVHSLVEWRIGLAVTAELYQVPDESQGARDWDKSVAIIWTGIRGTPPAL